MPYVIGQFAGHESHVALVGEGRIWHYENERFTRRRHETNFSEALVDKLIGASGVKPDEIVACVSVSGDLFNSSYSGDPWRDLCEIRQGTTTRLGEARPGFGINHHAAHAAYAFYTSPFESAKVLALDGGGDPFGIASCHESTDTAIGCMQQQYGGTTLTWGLEHSQAGVGAEWIAATFRIVQQRYAEGSVMALVGVQQEQFEALTSLPIERHAEVRELQASTTETFHRLLPSGECRNVVISGGCALNGLAVYSLLQRDDVDCVHVPPAVSDEGIAIGAAMLVLHHVLGVPRIKYEQAEVMFAGYTEPALEADPPIDRIVDSLTKGETVAIVHGRAESGPRALGHRSILADPRRIEMRNRINRIKGRKPYRPVAPVVLRRYAPELFELINPVCYEYMTTIAASKPRALEVLPAGVHYDGTARVQVADSSILIGRILEAWYQATGCPALLNTSFNLAGEAMANDMAQAFATFWRSEIDMLVIGKSVFRQ